MYPRAKDMSPPSGDDENVYGKYVTGTDSDASDQKIRDGKVPLLPGQLGILRLGNQRPKYQITDVGGAIAGRANGTLELGWNVQPWVGALKWRKSPLMRSGKMVDEEAKGGKSRGVHGSRSFDFPLLRTRADAADMGTAKGGEKNRGKPA